MKTILSILLAALTFNASADIIIYKSKLTVTITGGGAVTKGTITGYVVYDSDTSQVVLVKEYKTRGRFSFEWPGDWSLQTLSAGLNNKSVVLQIPGKGKGALTGNGKKAVTTEVGPFLDQSWELPKTMTVTGSDLYEQNGEHYLAEYKGTFTFDKVSTYDTNALSETLDELIQDIRDFYAAKGYVEE